MKLNVFNAFITANFLQFPVMHKNLNALAENLITAPQLLTKVAFLLFLFLGLAVIQG